MIRLRKLSAPSNVSLTDRIVYINAVRAYYEWAPRVYTPKACETVFLIEKHTKIVGFLDAELRNADLSSDQALYIFLNELHITPKMQRLGIGEDVLRGLLSKGVELEFVIANVNTKIRGLISKFSHEERYVMESTTTIRMFPDR